MFSNFFLFLIILEIFAPQRRNIHLGAPPDCPIRPGLIGQFAFLIGSKKIIRADRKLVDQVNKIRN